MDHSSLLYLKTFEGSPRSEIDKLGLPQTFRRSLTAFALGYEQIASALDCDYDLTIPRGLSRPKGLGGNWNVSRKALFLDASLPIFERSIWRASVLMRQSPASRQSKTLALTSSHKRKPSERRVPFSQFRRHDFPYRRIDALRSGGLTFAAMMSNWNFSQ